MADMEVDTTPHFSTTSHLDEDLIDYDSDVDKAHAPIEHIELAPETENHITDDDRHDGIGDPLDANDSLRREHGVTEKDELQDPEHDQQNDVHAEEKDTEELFEGYEEELEPSHGVQPESITHADTITGNEALVAQQEQEHHTTMSHAEDHQGAAPPHSTAEDHEIGWEQEEEQLEMISSDSKALRTADASENEATLESNSASQRANNVNGDQATGISPAEETEQQFEKADGVGDGVARHEVDYAKENENVEGDGYSQMESSDDGDHGFPAITVHYKNDEFPFFSLTSEGFFTHLSVLDENIKSLLAGFRAELANELVADEDLVFQVDELGLEFAESSSLEDLSNITLRQVLEVFDILTKNQDPESTRPLYTYLFTRPNTSKRFDFLMESATEGKGLDEVIYLFQSPMSHGTNGAVVADDGTAEHSNALGVGDDHLAQELGDDVADVTVEQDVDETYDQCMLPDEQRDDERPEDSDHTSGQHDRPAGYDDDSEDPLEESQNFDEAMASGALDEADDVGDGQEFEEQLPAQGDDQPLLTANPDEQPGNDGEDLLGLDFDEPAGGADVLIADVVDDAGQDFVEDKNLNFGLADASTTTTTLKDDGEATLTPADFGTAEFAAGDFTIDSPNNQNQINEIDWRDDLESRDDAGGDEDVFSNATKRARGDEEHNAEDDQNAKRRRP